MLNLSSFEIQCPQILFLTVLLSLILTGKSSFASSSWQSLSPSQGRWDTESLQTGVHLAVGSHLGGERPEEFH